MQGQLIRINASKQANKHNTYIRENPKLEKKL